MTLSGGQFVKPINPDNWSISNLPAGVSKGAVVRVAPNRVRITLNGNRTPDYHVNQTLTIQCTEDEIQGGNDGNPYTAIEEVTLVAKNPAVNFTNPLNQSTDTVGSGITLLAFRFTLVEVTNTIEFTHLTLERIGGSVPTFSNAKVYIDLNNNGVPEPTEEITADGAGGTINNGGNITVTYTDNGTEDAKIVFSDLRLHPSHLEHDIMIVGDTNVYAQVAIGHSYPNNIAREAVDPVESVPVGGSNVIHIIRN